MLRFIFTILISFFLIIHVALKAQGYNKDSLITAVLQSINADSIEKNVQDLQNFNTRFALAGNQKEIALFLAERFEGMGYTDVKLDSFFLDSVAWPYGSENYFSTWQYNVIVEETGFVNSDIIYILGAHYDAIVNPGDAFTFAPGADDNATGIAAALETARVFKLHNIQPAHTIRYVCFAAEELYLRGSDNYANKVQANNDNIVLMINNDMIGRNLEASNDLKFKIQKYPNTDWIELLTQEIAENYTLLTPVAATNSIEYSDSYPFYLRGYDAVFFQEYNFNTYLHTISDILDSLDMSYCAEVIKISCGLLLNGNIPSSTHDIIKTELIKIDISPNPAKEHIYLKLELQENVSFNIALFDIHSQKITENFFYMNKGSHTIPLDIKELSEGIYYCIVKTNKNIFNKKIIIL